MNFKDFLFIGGWLKFGMKTVAIKRTIINNLK